MQALKFVFDEDMSTVGGATGLTSITNPANWSLWLNGTVLLGAVSQVQYQWNPLSHKYEANVYFNATGPKGTLARGNYVLTLSNAL